MFLSPWFRKKTFVCPWFRTEAFVCPWFRNETFVCPWFRKKKFVCPWFRKETFVCPWFRKKSFVCPWFRPQTKSFIEFINPMTVLLQPLTVLLCRCQVFAKPAHNNPAGWFLVLNWRMINWLFGCMISALLTEPFTFLHSFTACIMKHCNND